jgi:tetratricopeptide (TPR) repeat protein
LLDVVEVAEAARVLAAEERDGEVHYTFGHELIRQTLLSSLSVLRRQRLHLAVADAIERVDPRARDDRPSEIAAHLLQAGAAADRRRTAEYLERAADRAADAAAFEEMLRAVDDAIALVGPDDALRLARLQERRGLATRALGRFDECVRIWDAVIQGYADAGLTEEAASLCAEAGYLLVWLNRFEEAFLYYARGLAIVGPVPSSDRARLLALSGGMTGLAGFYDAGIRHLNEAEAVARQLGDDRTLGQVLWARTMALWSHSRPTEATESGLAAVECLRRANDQWSLVDALAWTSYPLLMSGRPEAIEQGGRFAAEAQELGQRLGHPGGETLGVRGAVMHRSLSCDVEGLEQLARADLEAFERLQSPWVSMSRAWVASALTLRGDLHGAIAQSERAAETEPVSADRKSVV